MQNTKPKLRTSTLAIINFLFYIISVIIFILTVMANMHVLGFTTTDGSQRSSVILFITWLATLIMAIIDVRADNRKKTLSKFILIADIGGVIIIVISMIIMTIFYG